MSIKIEVKSNEIHVKSGTSARTGKPYTIREQEAWAYTADKEGKPHPYPVRIRVQLGDEQDAYPLGDYTISPASFYADRFNSLALGLVLSPVAKTLTKPGLATQAA